MKTTKTASSAMTITDCALSTMLEPTMLMASTARTMAVVKTLSQAGPASSPMNSAVA